MRSITRVDGQKQLELYAAVGRLVDAGTIWFLKNADETPIGDRIAWLQEARRALEPKLASLLPDFMRGKLDERAHGFFKAGAPASLADRLALLDMMELIPDIATVARQSKVDLVGAAKAFFAVTETFRISRIEDAVRSISVTDYYDGLALSRAADVIGGARKGIAVSALSAFGSAGQPVGAWLDAGGERITRTRERLQALTEGGDITRFAAVGGVGANE